MVPQSPAAAQPHRVPSPPPGPAGDAASGAQRDTRPLAARAGPPTSSAEHRHLGRRGRRKKKPNPKYTEVSSRAGQASALGAQGERPGLSSAGHGGLQPFWGLYTGKGEWGQRHLWCPVQSAAPGHPSSCQQQPLPGLHPSALPAGPPGPSAGSNASPGAGSGRAGLGTAPSTPHLTCRLDGTTASSPGRNARSEAREGMEGLRAGREWGERVRDGLGRHRVGSGVFHLVMLSLILRRLEQLLQDPDLLIGEIGTVRLHRCPEPAGTAEL